MYQRTNLCASIKEKQRDNTHLKTMKGALVRVVSIDGRWYEKRMFDTIYIILSLSHIFSYLVFYNIHCWSSEMVSVVWITLDGLLHH